MWVTRYTVPMQASEASFVWDTSWAVIAEQKGPCVAVQFQPVKPRKKPTPLPPSRVPERELEPA
jgi:hypothetical protein